MLNVFTGMKIFRVLVCVYTQMGGAAMYIHIGFMVEKEF